MPGDSVYFRASPNFPLMPCKAAAQDPLFPEHLLSGIDSGRARLIRVRSGLDRSGELPGLHRGLFPVLGLLVQILIQG